MKRITLILDGSADRPNAALMNKTPLAAANTPNLDALAQKATKLLRVKTIPDGLEVGSAVANMGLLGLDPRMYRGRAALEAAGSGIPLDPNNLYIRTNLATLTGDSYDTAVLSDYSAGELPTDKAAPIVELLREKVFNSPEYVLHHPESFRCILEVKGGAKLYPMQLAPAHDIIGRSVADFSGGERERPFMELQRRAFEVLKNTGTKCNAIWFWGDSLAPEFPKAEAGRCALGETILMRGITAAANIPIFPTEEAGRSFEAFLTEKADKAIAALNGGYERAYVHIQATDDLSHDRNPLGKRAAIEAADALVVRRLMNEVEGDFRLLVLSDHFTYSDTGSHGGDPVPCLYFDSTCPGNNPSARFTEALCDERYELTTAKGTVEMMDTVWYSDCGHRGACIYPPKRPVYLAAHYTHSSGNCGRGGGISYASLP